MRDDDLDLSAWDAPPPPDGLADAVIARLGGTAVGPAMPAADDEPRRRRWIVITASAAAVLLATFGTWIIVRGREHAPATSGEVVATRAQHLELGGVSAELDSGADVTWRRDAAIVHIEQKAGTAQWRIAGDQQVVIGAASASPVSIVAAGASLRVEVNMNMSDARVIGASTITAAAVAMVTVVVYEGHVRVSSAGQTVVVQPGATFTLPPPAPPPQPEPPIVGVAPVHGPTVAILGLDSGDAVGRELTNDLRDLAKTTGPFQLAPSSDKELVDEKLLHDCNDEMPSCMATIGEELGADMLIYGKVEAPRAGYGVTLMLLDVHARTPRRSLSVTIPTSDSSGARLLDQAKLLYDGLTSEGLTAGQIDAVMKAHAHDVQVCFQQHQVPGKVVIDLSIDETGKVAAAIPAATPDAALGTCIADAVAAFSFPAAHGRTRAKYPFAFAATTCDAKALEEKGINAFGAGKHAQALASFEQALACKPGDARLVKLSFMASCELKDLAKARTFWRQLAANEQATLVQICMRSGINPDDLNGDAPALEGKLGDDGVANIYCRPEAKLLIDGVDTGQTTPAHLQLSAGKHKVTFVVGQDRFTYPLTIRAGESETISKDLQ